MKRLATALGLVASLTVPVQGLIGNPNTRHQFDIGVDDDTEITLHGEVGVSAPIAGNLELVPGIRISYTTLDGGGDDLWVTQLRAGIRYSF